jgi:hypothetical protein
MSKNVMDTNESLSAEKLNMQEPHTTTDYKSESSLEFILPPYIASVPPDTYIFKAHLHFGSHILRHTYLEPHTFFWKDTHVRKGGVRIGVLVPCV